MRWLAGLVVVSLLASCGARSSLQSPADGTTRGERGAFDGSGQDAALADARRRDAPRPASWAISLGGKEQDWGYSLARDSVGDVYVTGHFAGSASLGALAISSAGDSDVFVAKLSAAGQPLWVRSAGGPEDDGGCAIAVDGGGNAYVAGLFRGKASFGGTTLSSHGGDDVFVAKYSSSGQLLWARSAGGSGADWGWSIDVDPSGSAVVTGRFHGEAIFTSAVPPLVSKGESDVFVAKLSSTGQFLWATAAGGPAEDAGWGLALDGGGSAHVTGRFRGTASFGGTLLSSTKGSDDIFVAKLSPAGQILWATAAGGPAEDAGWAIALDGAGNAAITGYFNGEATFGTFAIAEQGQGDAFVAKISPSGQFLWATSAGGKKLDRGYGIATDPAASSYITGYFNQAAAFGATTLSARGDWDIFVAKISPAGQFLWAGSAGGPGHERSSDIVLDGSGAALITGEHSDQATFGETTLTSEGILDVFVWKMFPP
jgi:hypothetical protein